MVVRERVAVLVRREEKEEQPLGGEDAGAQGGV